MTSKKNDKKMTENSAPSRFGSPPKFFFLFPPVFLYSSTPPHPGPEENVVELSTFERVLFFYDRTDKISLFLLKKTTVSS